jgi:hypothetical protein
MVGLVAVLLMGVVQRFGRTIEVTFVGSAATTGDLMKPSYNGSPPRRSSKSSDGRWHATDSDGKAISAPDLGGTPGRWVYDK